MKVADLAPALGIDLVTASRLHNLAEQERSRRAGGSEAKLLAPLAPRSSAGPTIAAHTALSSYGGAPLTRPQEFVTVEVYGDGQVARKSSPFSSHYPTAYPAQLRASFPEYEGEYMRTIQELNEASSNAYSFYKTNCFIWSIFCPCFVGLTLMFLCDDRTMDGRDIVAKKLNEIDARPHESYGFRVQFVANPGRDEMQAGKKVRLQPSLAVSMTRVR